ncbi:hypothetical protein [Nonomuraea sp. KM88]|uniref:hypothetical protein n=1 Tax=Nonomuraea sp. KM88 TaxID=3457427 RepID=UPI003FCE2396
MNRPDSLLAAHGRLDVHESLLDGLGCAGPGPARVERHPAALETVFDTAAAVRCPPKRAQARGAETAMSLC